MILEKKNGKIMIISTKKKRKRVHGNLPFFTVFSILFLIRIAQSDIHGKRKKRGIIR